MSLFTPYCAFLFGIFLVLALLGTNWQNVYGTPMTQCDNGALLYCDNVAMMQCYIDALHQKYKRSFCSKAL